MVQQLDRFGRFQFDWFTSGIDNSWIWTDFIQPLFDGAKADPRGFLTDLRAVVADDRGGFARFGAARLVWEIFSDEQMDNPDAQALIDAGIDFKLARGLTLVHFTGYERDRLMQRESASE
jgi:hypothetical protein